MKRNYVKVIACCSGNDHGVLPAYAHAKSKKERHSRPVGKSPFTDMERLRRSP